MPRAEKVEFVEYVLESIKLEMIVAIDDYIEEDNDTLIDAMIKKLIEHRMKKSELCEIVTINCI